MILSIYGQNKAGKTTLANMLVSEYGFVRISFADALREIAYTFFGIDISWKTDEPWSVTYGYLDRLGWLFSIIKDKNNIEKLMLDKIKHAKTKHQAYRITLELLGTEVFRNMVLSDIWCAIAVFNIIHFVSSGKNVVIDDTRFINEYNVLKNLNTVFIKITASFEESVGTHVSQKYISEFKEDYIIYNNGTKGDLFKEFKKLGIYNDK